MKNHPSSSTIRELILDLIDIQVVDVHHFLISTRRQARAERRALIHDAIERITAWRKAPRNGKRAKSGGAAWSAIRVEGEGRSLGAGTRQHLAGLMLELIDRASRRAAFFISFRMLMEKRQTQTDYGYRLILQAHDDS